MRYYVKKSHFYYINRNSILKSHITVVTAPYPHQKEQSTFSLTNK